jgi:hypothetical protein
MVFKIGNLRGCCARLRRAGRDERGFALVLALSMLAILSILCAALLSNSWTDLSVTKNFYGKQQALYAVDRAVEYGTSRSLLLSGSLDVINAQVDLSAATHKGKIDQEQDAEAGRGELESGTVVNLGPSSEIPAKLLAIYGSDFGANLYRVSAVGISGPATNRTKVNVEATIIRIFKNDDEGIYRDGRRG